MRIVVLALASAVLACGNKSSPSAPAPAPRDAAVVDAPLHRDLGQLAVRSVALYRDIVAAFTAAGEDCAVAAARLGELAKTYADVVAANELVEHEGRGAALEAALQPHDATLAEAARTIMHSPTLAKCAQDPAFGAAWGALVAPASSPAP